MTSDQQANPENPDKPLLSTEEIKAAPESDYMNDEQLAFFRNHLIQLHDTTRERIREAKEEMISPPDLMDDSDRASWEE